MNGENYVLNTVIEYSSKNLSAKEDEIRDKITLANFSDIGFRGSAWGASVSNVKSIEKLEIIEESEALLFYETTILDLKTFVGYLFTKGILTTGRYLVSESHTNKNDFLNDYNSLKNLLIKKYGEPLKDETVWKNNLYKDEYSDWGFAISLNHLLYYATWETKDSDITIMLSGENYKISLLIEMESINFKDLKQKEIEKEKLKGF